MGIRIRLLTSDTWESLASNPPGWRLSLTPPTAPILTAPSPLPNPTPFSLYPTLIKKDPPQTCLAT